MAATKTDAIYEDLKIYAEQNLNVLLVGGGGVGKTTMIKGVAEELDLDLKYYSSATLDPWADLVGIPVPTADNDTIKFLRPQDINNAEMIFFDELNRSHSKVQDAVLEIIQFHTINGEPLPNLKMCWAAINPPSEGYNVTDMDFVLTDRFQVQVEVPATISQKYLVNQGYSRDIVRTCAKWWQKDLSAEMRAKITPRRLEYIISAASTDINMIPDIIPWDVQAPTTILMKALSGEVLITIERDILVNDKAAYLTILQGTDEAEKQKTAKLIADCLTDGKIWTKTIVTLHELLLNIPHEFLMKISTQLGLKKRLKDADDDVKGMTGYVDLVNAL